MVRHRLTDEQWELVAPHIPVSAARTGRPARDPRQMLDAVLWVLVTGAAWRDLPAEAFGPWETAYYSFALWQRDGVFLKVVETLQVQLDEDGKLDWSAWCVDGTNIRGTRAAGDASQKVSTRTSRSLRITGRGGFPSTWAIPAADSAPNCIS